MEVELYAIPAVAAGIGVLLGAMVADWVFVMICAALSLALAAILFLPDWSGVPERTEAAGLLLVGLGFGLFVVFPLVGGLALGTAMRKLTRRLSASRNSL